jgi:amidase
VSRSPGKLRIAWSAATPNGRPFDPEVRDALVRTAELLKALGHEVIEKDFDIDWRVFYRAQSLVSASNFAAGMMRMVERLGREPGDGEIGPLARRAYEAGKRITGQQAMWGWQQLRLMNRKILALFETVEVYLCPVLGAPPPRVDHVDPLMDDLKEYDRRSSTAFPFTPPFNITGQPSLSLPLWQSASNLPIAMMFTGRYGDEAALFRLAGQLEKECPWKDRKPPIWN